MLRRTHPDLKHRIRTALRGLAKDPGSGEPLTGELEGLWKAAVGQMRVIYEIGRDTVTVHAITRRER